MIAGDATAAETEQWTLSRIDIRSSVERDAWPVARLSLHHPRRGPVTDIGTAPGAFDAAFNALAHITGVDANLLSYEVRSISSTAEALTISVEVVIEIEGRPWVGKSVGVDLVRCSVEAWLQAAQRFSGPTDPRIPTHCRSGRRFVVSGLDCNDDLWLFASSDKGTAEAIAEEFIRDEYADVRVF